MNDLVKIERLNKKDRSLSGEVNNEKVTIAPNVKCNLQPDTGDIIMAAAGETAINFIRMYCDMIDIREKDVVTDLATNSRYKVIEVKQYNQVCYTKVRLQGGVV